MSSGYSCRSSGPAVTWQGKHAIDLRSDPMNEGTDVQWYQRPAPTLLVGLALLVLCGLSAAVWLSGGPGISRAVGGIAGAGGIYLTVGGVMGLRERDSQ
jgi:hypothetical protein